jgi:hypothetical protein
MVVKDIIQPLTSEQLMNVLENNESRVMFPYRDSQIEISLRKDVLAFDQILQKYPPVYASNLTDNVNNIYVSFRTNLIRNKRELRRCFSLRPEETYGEEFEFVNAID